MGRRCEPRVAITLPVVVRGSDARGIPFVANTETRNISSAGACLNNLNGIVAPGDKVEIQCHDQKATFRIQWVGEKGGPRVGQAGVRCVEPDKYIWGIAAREWEADAYEFSEPAPAATLPAPAPARPPRPAPPVSAYTASASYADQERRQFVRHACRIAAQVTLQDGSLKLSGTVTDISLGGCYIEMFSPLPVDTFVEMYLHPGDATLHVSARVRSSQKGAGMGVAFTGMSPDVFEKLRAFAPPAAQSAESQPAKPERERQPAPVVVASPPRDPRTESAPVAEFDLSDLTITPEVFSALLRVLVRRGLVTRAELLEELEKMKVPHA
jgi:hypothetical protein